DAGASCDGRCDGTCSEPMQGTACRGKLDCGQNVECGNACAVKAALTLKCTPPAGIELEAVSDSKLHDAIKNHGGALAVAIQTLNALRTAELAIQDRGISDFEAIHATGEVVRACVNRGQAALSKADTAIKAAVNADPTRRKSQ